MSKEIPLKLIVGAISDEKGVSNDVVFEALEAALVSATKKKSEKDIDVRVDIDRKTGRYDTFRFWTVVEDPEPGQAIEYPLTQITLSAAKLDNPEAAVGDIIEEPMESVEFGRIAAQTAKQVIIQKVREAERSNVAKDFEKKIGELLTGTVKKTNREGVLVDLGSSAEGLLKKENMLPREAYRNGDRVRALLVEVNMSPRGPQLVLSRASKDMLIALFELEVPEVGEGIIQIMGAARDPGHRSKIAVKTNDGRMDPVGACVGMRGARVQAVSNEIGGERVDIVLWDENPAQYVINAMAPADVVSIVVDEESNSMDIAVAEESLSQAIGRNGQNVRLASQLTGWTLNVISDKVAKDKTEEEQTRLRAVFVEGLDVDDDVADVLIEEGFTSLEEIAYIPASELLEIEDFDEDIVNELRQRAKDKLLSEALASEEELQSKLQAEVLELDGMTKQIAIGLAKSDVFTKDDVAELSVDDFMNMAEISEEDAAKIIMAARAHWFADEN